MELWGRSETRARRCAVNECKTHRTEDLIVHSKNTSKVVTFFHMKSKKRQKIVLFLCPDDRNILFFWFTRFDQIPVIIPFRWACSCGPSNGKILITERQTIFVNLFSLYGWKWHGYLGALKRMWITKVPKEWVRLDSYELQWLNWEDPFSWTRSPEGLFKSSIMKILHISSSPTRTNCSWWVDWRRVTLPTCYSPAAETLFW